MSSLKSNIFKSKVILFSFVISLFLCTLDAIGRFGSPVKGNVEFLVPQFSQVVNSNSLTEDQITAIVALYSRYLGEDSNEVKANVAAEVIEQSDQSGELKQIYIDDKMLTLKAVINDGISAQPKIRILINIQDVNTNKSEVVAFTPQSDVFGYSLVNIQNTQVTLKSIATNQEITLTMYQPTIKNQKGS